MHSLSASGLVERNSVCSRLSSRAAKQSQKCKVAFSREYGSYPNDPLLLAQSLTAKSREFVHQHQDAAAAAAAAAVEGPEGLAGLLESVRARFASFGLQHFEEVALQLGQLGYEPDDEWLASFERHSMAVMPGGSPRLLSRLLLARSKLPGACSSSWCGACLEAMTAQPERLTVSSWVNALWALVRLKHAPGRTFQAVFFSSTASRLDDVSPELLTHLAWSLSRLQLQPSYLWWRSLVNATAGIEKAFSHGQLASLIHSVALWAEPGGIHMRDVQRLVDLLLVEVDCQLAVMQPGELTTILWSLGSLNFAGKYVPDCEVQDALLAAIQGQLPRLNPGQLASLCWGLAKLQHPLPEGFAEALLLEVQAQVQGFADGGLANVMWALAKLRLQPGVAFKEALWEELHARCSSLTLHDLSTLLWAIARLPLQPPADLLGELTQQSLTLLREVHGRLLHARNFTPTPTSRREFAELTEATANLVLAELGVGGLAEGAAAADQSFSDEESALNGYCAVEFQPGCR
ncbi:hypothetical protein OEZ86_014099 [Tetradesmus obliquus]|nr:hypothetical protein OEZ86_014099 [Tetradesmus obliquus]